MLMRATTMMMIQIRHLQYCNKANFYFQNYIWPKKKKTKKKKLVTTMMKILEWGEKTYYAFWVMAYTQKLFKAKHHVCSLELKKIWNQKQLQFHSRESSFVLYICGIMLRSRDVVRCSVESIFTAWLHWFKPWYEKSWCQKHHRVDVSPFVTIVSI